jgi:CheY-like chemotaxis protein
MGPGMRIGDLLVEAGIITVKTLERALAMQKGSGKRLGALLNEMGIVTEEEVIEALARQCNLKTVSNFAQRPYHRELLDLIPRQTAMEKLIFPLKRYDGILSVAILDPFDSDTIGALVEKTGMRIYPVLATRNDICAAIRKHYGKGNRDRNSGQKVLLVDPSAVIAKMYESALAKEGFEVLLATDGIDGLKVAFARHPDLVICDRMVQRMDSYNFMCALRAHPETATIPSVLMSSNPSVEEEKTALEAGFTDFIGKPATPMHLVARIRQLFNSLEEGTTTAQEGSTDDRADICESSC